MSIQDTAVLVQLSHQSWPEFLAPEGWMRNIIKYCLADSIDGKHKLKIIKGFNLSMCKWKQIDNPEAGIKVPAGQK